VDIGTHRSETHFARSMRATAVKYQEITALFAAETKATVAHKEFLGLWKWDSIEVACEPKCEGSRCGNYHPGAKEMTLNGKRELKIIRKGFTYSTSKQILSVMKPTVAQNTPVFKIQVLFPTTRVGWKPPSREQKNNSKKSENSIHSLSP